MSEALPEPWQFLLEPGGQRLLKDLGDETEASLSSIEIVTQLRSKGLSAEHASALLSQATLRKRAFTKFGDAANTMLFTQAGLEQSTRAIVANTHAERFARVGLGSVVDLGCGIGAESRAFAAADIRVQSVELDPVTAEIARFNLRGYPAASVILADAEQFELGDAESAFLDPARRTAGLHNTTRITNTDEYTPSLDFAFGLGAKLPTAIKLGPGFDRKRIPIDAHAQWTSVDGEAVEMMLWFGALAKAGIRRSALIIRGQTTHELAAPHDSEDAPVRELGEFLYEPDPAVIRARLIGHLSRSIDAANDLGMLDERIAYLTADTVVETPFAQGFRIREVLPASESRLKKALRERRIGRLEIKKRGMDVDPAALRKRLALRGELEATLILTRTSVRGKTERVALLADRL